MSKPHEIDFYMDWCKCCGRPYEEIFNQNLVECDGLPGVVHKRFLDARAKCMAIFGSIVDRLREPNG
jgi:hypothetical protein